MAKEKLSLNIDDMTLGDMDDFERATGMLISEAFKESFVLDENGRKVPDPDDPKGRPLKQVEMPTRALIGMIWIAKRKEQAGLTIEDVRSYRLSEFELDLETPTDASDEETDEPTREESDKMPSSESD